jgi:hypothetical protein
MKKACERSKAEISHLQKVAGPDICCVIAQKGRPLLSCGLKGTNVPHVLLNGQLAHVNVQFQEFSTNPLSTPESILRRHLSNQGDGFRGYLRLIRSSLRLALPDHAKELTMEAATVCLVERVMWACFQVRTNLASRTTSVRSALLQAGCCTCRPRMMTCWRKKAFSAMSWDLLRPMSVSVPSGNERVSGFVQRIKRG